ncbi:hypothetical protein [Zobellella iuensis]|uniref:Uncharacterized protein n=1 Tax=Zobellella iuensis TaxID=2803811 RepID=A0ABS1QX17_9GAMM|nr:hypothetical protein [Zobellella iuensis]MBL1379177.1 hypothetical protein [Zobellella iuensis]
MELDGRLPHGGLVAALTIGQEPLFICLYWGLMGATHQKQAHQAGGEEVFHGTVPSGYHVVQCSQIMVIMPDVEPG